MMFHRLSPYKVRVSRKGVSAFNAQYPASKLRSGRTYMFEFDLNGNLVDTDVPEQDDGYEALVLSADCQAWLFDKTKPSWWG